MAPTEPPRPAQITSERHENVTITQHANAAPGSVVIQIAGNAKIEGQSAGSTE
jgi:hypothetical protein